MENSETEGEQEVVRLPLWKSCAERMVKEGCDHGQTYPVEFFEKALKCKRDTMQFGLAISEVRTYLLKTGMYLSGRGQKGEQYVILDAAANAQVMQNFQVEAARALQKGVILGSNTRLDLLTEAERKKHEGVLERLAVRTALFARKTPALIKALTHANKKPLKS